jgi:hypothetical protein
MMCLIDAKLHNGFQREGIDSCFLFSYPNNLATAQYSGLIPDMVAPEQRGSAN